MKTILQFEDLNAWKEARKLSTMIFHLCRNPEIRTEFSLINQIKSSSISIMANIAEGFGRYGFKDSKQFYIISRGSLAETQSYLYIFRDLKFISENQFNEIFKQSIITNKLINGLISNTIRYMKLKNKQQNKPLNT